MRLPLLLILSLGLAACLPGGRDLPPTLATLAVSAPEPASMDRTGNEENTVAIELPIVPQELQADRVPVHVGPAAVAYVTDVVWVDRPAALFRQLLSETVQRTTGRIVLDPGQGLTEPGIRVTGTLRHFGYFEDTGEVVVVYDAALRRAGVVESRRFEARYPADGTSLTVPQSLNVAANQVAGEVAAWIGG